MFSIFKKYHKKSFFSEFSSEGKKILKDILFVYKNFIHWNISKLIISIWSIILAMGVAFPFFVLALIVGLIDPIPWVSIIGYVLTGTDISLELIGSLAQHPYWIAIMVFLIATCIVIFLLASSYSLILQAHLIFSYTKGKKLGFKDNLYFSKTHISTLMGILCWNMAYLIAPIFIGLSIMLGIYVLHIDLGIISGEVFGILTLIITFIFAFIMSFVVYKILFGYIILSEEKVKKIKSSRHHLLASMKLTHLRNYFKFLIILVIYFIVMIPFQGVQNYIDTSLVSMRDALYYKAGQIDTIQPEEKQYYEYITQEYKEVSAKELVTNITFMSYINIFYYFLSYFLFGGLFVVIAVSFYKRVLLQK